MMHLASFGHDRQGVSYQYRHTYHIAVRKKSWLFVLCRRDDVKPEGPGQETNQYTSMMISKFGISFSSSFSAKTCFQLSGLCIMDYY